MKAVILAAGVGSRLKHLTGDRPKCMVRVNGKPIVDHQIEALLGAGIERVFIVAGFAAEVLAAHVAHRYPGDARVELVENRDYAVTNNMYSLSLCSARVDGEPFLLMNGDVVFDAGIVRDLIDAEGGAVCVDVGAYHDESMKVTLHPERDEIARISKQITPEQSFGSSIDVYRFDADGARVLFAHVHEIIHGQQRRNDWTEVALDELMRSRRLPMRPFDIQGRKWFEIDNMDDLHKAEALFRLDPIAWERLKIAFVDMDGTLYKGTQAFPGVSRFVDELRRRVDRVYFLSNNSSAGHEQVRDRLSSMGVDLRIEDIVISSDALGAYLRRAGIQRACVVGTTALQRVLETYGVRHDETAPEAVVVGYDLELTYAKLCNASYFLQQDGMPYFATHLDVVCPTERGNVPDVGAMIALLERVTGRVPERAFGKPDLEMVRPLLERHGVRGDECVFFGDRVYTDYALARKCGASFVGVLSGEATRADFEPLDGVVVVSSVAEVFDDPPHARSGRRFPEAES